MKFRWQFCPLIVVAMIASCTPKESQSSKQNASKEYGIVTDQEILLADCLSQEERNYIIFFHSDKCEHCKQIIDDVIEFAAENILKTYFVNIAKNENKIKICQPIDLTIGVTDVNELAIVGTPTIIEVEEGMTIANAPGKESCLMFLNEQRAKYEM